MRQRASRNSPGAVRHAGALKQRAFGGFMWLSMGNAVRAVTKVAVVAVLARLLAPEEFGLVAAAGVVVWFSMLFSSMGVGPALIQRPKLGRIEVTTAFITSVALGLVAGVLIYALAPQIADLFRMPALIPVLRAMSLVFVIAAVGAVSECLLQRELRFREIAAIELLSYAFGYAVFGIALAWLGFGVWALVAAELVKTAIKTALFLKARPIPARPAFDGAVFRDLLRFGSAYSATSFSTYLASQGDSFVVARFLGAAALGVYGRAYELMMVPAQALGALLDKILFPTLARVQRDRARVAFAYRRCTALVALLVLPLSVGSIVLAPEIVRALLGPAWEEAVLPLQILCFGMYFRVGYMVGHSVAHAMGAVRQTAWRNAIYAALVVTLALLGRRWGLPGVAAGVVLAITANFYMVLTLGAKLTGTGWVDLGRLHARPAFLALLLGSEIWLAAAACRAIEAAAVVTLGVTAIALAATLLGVLRFAPALLGKEGLWLIMLLYPKIPARFRPLLGTPAP